jgi:hypothetical protein
VGSAAITLALAVEPNALPAVRLIGWFDFFMAAIYGGNAAELRQSLLLSSEKCAGNHTKPSNQYPQPLQQAEVLDVMRQTSDVCDDHMATLESYPKLLPSSNV